MIFAPTGFGAMGGGDSMMFGIDPIVAPDGTVLTVRSSVEHEHGSGPMQGAGMDLIAVSPNGSIAWTYEANTGIHDVELVGDMVILAVVEGDAFGWWDGVDDESTSSVVALTLAAGTVAWELELDEVVRSIEGATDRLYAVSGMHGRHHSESGRSVSRPGFGFGHGPGHGPGGQTGPEERTLFAIGLDGQLLWTVSLSD
ncbi:MAG: hypothetical protein R3338_08700 [Thermoanaerobaculia bacterium]|nr:hypothetical protein [Thermoanaerobaculia bacterium]